MRSKRSIIIAGALFFAVLVTVGYFSAEKKSEPIYLSKIDKIMFDSKNKSPKYVITLPEKDKKEIEKRAIKPEELDAKEEKITLEKLLTNIPSLKKLEPMSNDAIVPLRHTYVDSELVESFEGQKLPKVNKNRKPWIEYGRRVNVAPNFKKVAIVIKKMGLDDNLTEVTYKGLPSNVSLSFSPYAKDFDKQIIEARKLGHETYMDVILLTQDFSVSDTGPKAIDLSQANDEILKGLRNILSVNAPIGGVVVNRGVYKDECKGQIPMLLEELKGRGLMVIDATENEVFDEQNNVNLPRKRADVSIDRDFDRKSIQKSLRQAEKIAMEKGYVLVVATPKPVVLVALKEWINSFSPQLSYEEMVARGEDPSNIERPFALVPASALVVE